MNVNIIMITGPAQLAKSETMSFLPIYGNIDQCLATLEKLYPWLDGCTGYFQASVGILYVPAEFLAVPHVA